ncbi:MAG TPA: TIM44-like domain-containing protein [Polyangiales bacterium]|nr:TIM44-like domain-containing protein [Polyangiales bacterium]
MRLFGVALVWSCAAVAFARPGGGETFSSPGRDGGGGGDGAIVFELIWFLLRLTFMYPKLMLPVLLVIAFLIWRSRQVRLEDWTTPQHPHPPVMRTDLTAVKTIDPDFSQVLFEDFAYRLYATVQRARPKGLDALAPYLESSVRESLVRPDWPAVTSVVVGAMRVISCQLASEWVHVELGYEANIGLPDRNLYVRERWQLRRSTKARTQPPKATRLGCPNCGAPFRSTDHRRCEHCGQVVADGRFDWQLFAYSVLDERAQPPALTADVEEQGTDRPTVFAPDFQAQWQALCAKDPALQVQLLLDRTVLIHHELNASNGELERVRALISEGMVDYLGYWLEAYRAQGLRNLTEQVRITHAELVKVTRDRWFDAVTVRLFATGLDYTVDAKGDVVRGSKRRERDYSEYWTLIRGSGTRGAPRSEASCPNCGAPLAATMAGTCKYCEVHVTGGEFDWVLSKIEQDDVY